jgi:uncharacterized membrane protein YeiB
MAKKKPNSLKRPMTFSSGSVLFFVLAFAVVGAFAIWKSSAAGLPKPPRTPSTATCNTTSPITVGQNYAGTISGLSTTNNHVYNMFTTYGDGSTWNYVLGNLTFTTGYYQVGGYAAKVKGTTTFKLTDYSEKNFNNTYIYATCTVQVI